MENPSASFRYSGIRIRIAILSCGASGHPPFQRSVSAFRFGERLRQSEPAVCSAVELRRRLLDGDPPLVGRMDEQGFCLDPRTLCDHDHARVAALLRAALTERIQP